MEKRPGFRPAVLFREPFVHAVAGRVPLRAHVEQVDEEVVRQRTRLAGEDAVLGVSRIRAEHAQAADQNRHFGRRQPQQSVPGPPTLPRAP